MNYNELIDQCIHAYKGDKDFALYVSEVLTKNNPSKADIISFMQILNNEMEKVVDAGYSTLHSEYTLRVSLSVAIHNWAMVNGYFSTPTRNYTH